MWSKFVNAFASGVAFMMSVLSYLQGRSSYFLFFGALTLFNAWIYKYKCEEEEEKHL